jgi:hypothetical protein
MNTLTIRRWLDRLAPILWATALIGYFAPWVARNPMSAALAWNAYDLFDLLRLLPEVESGAISVNLQALRLPLLGLAMIPPLLLHRVSAWFRWTAGLFGAFLAALTLPPYPAILEAWRLPGWSGVLGWAIAGAVLALSFVPLAPQLKRYRGWIIIAIVCLTAIPASVTLHRILPPLSRLHATPVRAGWGHWLCIFGMGLIGVGAWFQTILQGADNE